MTVPPQPQPNPQQQPYPTGYPPPTGQPLPPSPVPATDQAFGAPAVTPPPGMDEKGHVRLTKVSAVWIGLIATALVLIALLIFIAQNSASVTVHYLGANGRVPLAVALLLSAIAGLLIAAIPGTVRILQLRRSVKQNAAKR
jgi:uncharacterized integral membrane protein